MPSANPFTRLRPGDRVAVIAPASAPDPDRLRAGVEVLASWGLEAVILPSATTSRRHLGDLAADDFVRAHDVIKASGDPEVAAIWAARGGYGVQRMIDLVPHGNFNPRSRCRPIIGFSDLTPLLLRAMCESGTQMIHGPMVVNLGEAPEEALDHLHRLLFEPHVPRTLVTGLTSWSGGDVQGVLLGGNVSLLAASVGTRDLPKPEGAIVLLEDVGQPQWVIDRALTQLIRAGWLSRAAGILLGDFSLDDDPALVTAMLRDRLLPLGVPVWAGMPAGHEQLNLALPVGAMVRIVGGYLRLA